MTIANEGRPTYPHDILCGRQAVTEGKSSGIPQKDPQPPTLDRFYAQRGSRMGW